MLRSWRHLYRIPRSTNGSWILARTTGVKGVSKSGRTDWSRCFPYANGFCCTSNYVPDEHFSTNHGIDRAEMRTTTKSVLLSRPVDHVHSMYFIDNTTHRDGSIYRKDNGFIGSFRVIDRDETRLEPMMLSEATDCHFDRERCIVHYPTRMMQIFSLKLSQIPIDSDSIEIYGYIAVRDCYDFLLNYIVNCSRYDPIIVQQGSLIEMTGPKRGISIESSVLFEFDMRIKKGEQEEDDLQLIDGVLYYCEITQPPRLFTNRIKGDCGAVDITSALVYSAVEATIEVVISNVHSSFSLSLSSFVFIAGLHEEIQLFLGNIGDSCGLRRYVIAVTMDTWMHLKFKIGQGGYKMDLERYCSFKANNHGYTSQQILLELASISVKVTWSTVLL